MRRDAGVAIPAYLDLVMARLALFGLYAADEEFAGELARLLARQPSDGASEADDPFRADVADVAYRFGLSRVPGGMESIERWHRYATARASAGRPPPPFTIAVTGGDFVGDPQVSDTLRLEWDPASERPQEARRRLKTEALAAVGRLIEAGVERTKRSKYSFSHDRPERHRDVTWLFWRIRYGWDPARICEEWDRTQGSDFWVWRGQDVVEKQVRRLAKTLGIDARGWHSAEHGPRH